MKKFIISMMMISNFSTFAQVLNPQDGYLIMKAALMSLEQDVLVCHDGTQAFPSSEIGFPLEYTEVKINEGSQPVILAKAEASTAIWEAKISTDKNFKKVTQINILVSEKKMRKVNVGTIIKPVFEHQAYLEISESIFCKNKLSP